MNVLGIETSCDETGVAVYSTEHGLLAQALHSQVAMHERFGGVVPELASRDHVNRVLPLTREVLAQAGLVLPQIDAVAFTEGPGLAGALLVGAATGCALAWALGKPAIGVHHLEGHLLSPLLGADPPDFPFVALLVSGGHTQLMTVTGVGRYELLGDTVDDAAGEAFDKSAKLLGLGYPGGPALAALAEKGRGGQFTLPRPKLHADDLDFSFSGLKTAVLTTIRKGLLGRRPGQEHPGQEQPGDEQSDVDRRAEAQARADLAHEVQAAITDVLVAKSVKALQQTGASRLVVAGGVSANKRLRALLAARQNELGFRVYFPELALCTDNGAMIAFAGALRLQHARSTRPPTLFQVRPRWPLSELTAPQALTPR